MASADRNTPETTYIPRLALTVCILGVILYFSMLDHPLIPADQILLRQVTHGDVSESGLAMRRAELHQFDFKFVFRPLTHTFLHQQWKIWGNSPSSHHAVSLFAYLACVILFMFFAGHLTHRKWVVIIASLVFTLHPMLSQSVVSLHGLAGLLALSSVLGASIVFRRHQLNLIGHGKAAILIVLLQVSAAFSHEFGYLLPLCLALQWILLPVRPGVHVSEKPRKSRLNRESGREKQLGVRSRFADVFTVFVPLLIMTSSIVVYRFISTTHPLPPRTAYSGVMEPGLPAAFMHSVEIFSSYIVRMVWPVRPTLFHHPVYPSGIVTPWLIGLVVFLALGLLIIFRFRNHPFMIYSFCVLTLSILAFSQFIRFDPMISELYVLFMLPGLSLLAGGLAGLNISPDRRFPPETMFDRGVLCVALGVMILFGWQTWKRNEQWKDSITLLKAEKQNHPGNPVPLILGAIDLIQLGDMDGSLEWINDARELSSQADLETLVELEVLIYGNKSDRPHMLERIYAVINSDKPASEQHFTQLAQLCRQFSQYDLKTESEQLWRKGLEYYPRSFAALSGLAELSMERGELNEAIRLGARSVSAASIDEKLMAVTRYGTILADSGMASQDNEILKKAVFQLKDIIRTDQSSYEAYLKLTEIYIFIKQFNHALDAINRCLQNSITDSYVEIARLYCRVLKEQNKLDFAIQWLEQTIRSHPQDIRLQIFAGRFLEANGVYEEARNMFESLRLLDLRGSLKADVLTGLALVAANSDKDYELAWALAKEARKADSKHEGAIQMVQEARRLLRKQQESSGESGPGQSRLSLRKDKIRV
jgi:lipopolysaccharide biosynthesis regulator YciM